MKTGKLFFTFLLAFLATNVFADPDPSPKQRTTHTLEKKFSELEKEVTLLRKEIGLLKMQGVPDNLSLFDRQIPISNEDIREKFEREFYQFQENKGLLTILVKRHTKFLAVVSEELNKANLPPDLIYLAIAESYLNPRAISKANAGGMWQFIRETGKREGLYIDEHVDERYSVKRSTKSAMAYLKKLHGEFGDWLIAIAAYNAGEGRLREAISNQDTRDFFELFVPEETERYIYRISAIKELLSNPKKYGLTIEKRDYYRPYAVTEVVLEVGKETHTLTLAQCMDLPYKTFREYNLHMRRYKLPRGIYHVYIPAEKKQTFLKKIRMIPNVYPQAN